MISYIKGEITFNEGDTLVVENNGIGYEITVPTFSAQQLLSKGGEVMVYTYMSVREDGISLFGFESREEKAFYQKLISVSGIGPKAAISILSSITPSELVTAVLSSDAAAIAKAPGVGKKTAQRVILELKDKIGSGDIAEMFDMGSDISSASAATGDDRAEAAEALVALGYSRSEAVKAVSKVYVPDMDVQKILSAALRELSRI